MMLNKRQAEKLEKPENIDMAGNPQEMEEAEKLENMGRNKIAGDLKHCLVELGRRRLRGTRLERAIDNHDPGSTWDGYTTKAGDWKFR